MAICCNRLGSILVEEHRQVGGCSHQTGRFATSRHHNTSLMHLLIDVVGYSDDHCWNNARSTETKTVIAMLYNIKTGLVECNTLRQKLVLPSSHMRRGQWNTLITGRSRPRLMTHLSRGRPVFEQSTSHLQ